MGKGESGLQCRCNKPTDQHRSANGWLGFLASSVFTATTAEAAAAVHTAWRPIKHKNAGFARQQRSEVKEEDETVGKIKLRLMDPRSQKHTFFVCKKLNNIGGFRTSLVHRSQFSFSVLNDGGEQQPPLEMDVDLDQPTLLPSGGARSLCWPMAEAWEKIHLPHA